MYHEFTLSDEFRKNHFLAGLLLQEVKSALNESHEIRKVAVVILRNLLVKHAFDERYMSKVYMHHIFKILLCLHCNSLFHENNSQTYTLKYILSLFRTYIHTYLHCMLKM